LYVLSGYQNLNNITFADLKYLVHETSSVNKSNIKFFNSRRCNASHGVTPFDFILWGFAKDNRYLTKMLDKTDLNQKVTAPLATTDDLCNEYGMKSITALMCFVQITIPM